MCRDAKVGYSIPALWHCFSAIAAHSPVSRWMNHYAIEPVACTPASGWEKAQIENQVQNQVQNIRRWLFTPKLKFDDLNSLNEWLGQSCINLAARPHPEQKVRTIAEVFEGERAVLRPLGEGFDGYVERATRVLSTCLVQYDSNRYSVPSDYAGKPVSLRAYADTIMVVSGVNVLAEHKRCFMRNISTFEPWQLPVSMAKIKDQYRERQKDCVISH